MRIYFSGIGGVGIGPLAEIAADANYQVVGSDQAESLMTQQLRQRGIEVGLDQSGKFLAEQHRHSPIDWYVYTSALPKDHPELIQASEIGIRISKRDEFLAEFIKNQQLNLIAIAGTHGKTTTTGLMVWALQQLDVPASHSIGTTISYAPSGSFTSDSKLFIYECDEYDRNFLHFSPHLSLITALEHDHVDTYPKIDDYRSAFVEFLEKSNEALMWQKDFRFLQTDPSADLEIYDDNSDFTRLTLPGKHVRQNAFLVYQAIKKLLPEITDEKIIRALNTFPGTARRFEKLSDNLYSDYGHHPAEIAATLQLASEVADKISLVYQPHQNIRQHEVRHLYTDCMQIADKVYWLPTYLSREDPALEILTPEQLSHNLINKNSVEIADLDDRLWDKIQQDISKGNLVLVMGAGSVDGWLRQQIDDRS